MAMSWRYSPTPVIALALLPAVAAAHGIDWPGPPDPRKQAAVQVYQRGVDWYFRGQNDLAIRDFDEALPLNPRYAPAYSFRGAARSEKREYGLAIRDYGMAIVLNPKDDLAYFGRGNAWRATKQYGRALRDYDEVIRLKPQDALGYNNKAWVLATCPEAKYRDGKRAVELARKACELSKWRLFFTWDTLAAAYAEAGEFEEAVKWQGRAAEESVKLKLGGGAAKKRPRLYEAKKPYRDEGE
jgi:tetratricopeptide (TPR) repeat protein